MVTWRVMRLARACLLLLVGLSAACASRAASSNATLAPAVILRPAGKPETRVAVEIARTEADRERGLMYRDRLAPDAGMLFVFDHEEQQRFWMKNTYISLDMIFITKDLHVLGVVERAEPLTTTGRFVPGPSQFVLEVVGGYAAQHGIGPGTQVELFHVD